MSKQGMNLVLLKLIKMKNSKKFKMAIRHILIPNGAGIILEQEEINSFVKHFMNKIYKISYKINVETKMAVFFEISGHVNLFSLSIYQSKEDTNSPEARFQLWFRQSDNMNVIPCTFDDVLKLFKVDQFLRMCYDKREVDFDRLQPCLDNSFPHYQIIGL